MKAMRFDDVDYFGTLALVLDSVRLVLDSVLPNFLISLYGITDNNTCCNFKQILSLLLLITYYGYLLPKIIIFHFMIILILT